MDNSRYKSIRLKWHHSGDVDPHCEEKLSYVHPNSPSTGKSWMSDKVSFKTLRLTNNKSHEKCSVSVPIFKMRFHKRTYEAMSICSKNKDKNYFKVMMFKYYKILYNQLICVLLIFTFLSHTHKIKLY